MNDHVRQLLNIQLREISETYSLDEFLLECQKFNRLLVIISFQMVGNSSSHIDVANEYLTISYFAEKIAEISDDCKGRIVSRNSYYLDFEFEVSPLDKNEVGEFIYIASLFLADDDRLEEDIREDIFDELDVYQLNFGKLTFEFPDLANDYWANHIASYGEIASEYYETEREFYTKTFKKYPEHRFFFWKNAKSKYDNSRIYFSIYNWIIPSKTDLQKALKEYSGFEKDLIFQKAEIIEYKNSFVIASSSDAVWFDRLTHFKNSLACANRTLSQKAEFNSNSSLIQASLFEDYPGKIIRRKPRSNQSRLEVNTGLLKSCEYQLSEFGEILIIKKDDVSHVFFNMSGVSFEDLKELQEKLNPIYANIQSLIGQSCLGNCDWQKLDDDTFEEMCYDILYCHPKFDSGTIQKMGKSRSRDGGRDITVKTKRTQTSEPVLYVFQCKYLNENSSLSASKLPNAGNVIMQYGAYGYGVFTSTVIDSTLYDMLDGFQRNMKIDTSIRWSKYELERFFNHNKILKKKYF